MNNKDFLQEIEDGRNKIFLDTNIILNHNLFIKNTLLDYFNKNGKIHILCSVEQELNNLKKRKKEDINFLKKINKARKFLNIYKNNIIYYNPYIDDIIGYSNYFDFEIYKTFLSFLFKNKSVILTLLTNDVDLQEAVLKLNYNKLINNNDLIVKKIRVYRISSGKYIKVNLTNSNITNISNIRYRQEEDIKEAIKKKYELKYENLKNYCKNIIKDMKEGKRVNLTELKSKFEDEEEFDKEINEEIENRENELYYENPDADEEEFYYELNYKDEDLFYFVKENLIENLSLALENAYTLSLVRDENNLNLLHNAIIYKRKDIIKFLLENELSLEKGGEDINPPIYYAIEDSDILNFLFEISEVNLNIKNYEGLSLLHWAIESLKIESIKYLLDKYININSTDIKGLTPLHYSVKKKDTDIINLLIQYGARKNIKSIKKDYYFDYDSSENKIIELDEGLTPYDFALRLSIDFNIVELLKEEEI